MTKRARKGTSLRLARGHLRGDRQRVADRDRARSLTGQRGQRSKPRIPAWLQLPSAQHDDNDGGGA